MLYRENGQLKTSYRADQQIFPILQDRVLIAGVLLFAFVAVPFFGDDYLFRAIVIPWLVLSLAAIGLNLLVGYDPARVFAMGWSYGGGAILDALAATAPERIPFRGAVLFYPDCHLARAHGGRRSRC